MERRGDLLELKWSDTEERLQGSLHPAIPREGEPFTLSLHVGNFQGAEFDGPLTITFQQPGSPALVTRTLTREGVNWHTELTPDAPGLWDLEVRYRNTHLKVLTARIPVSDQPLPRGIGWALIITAAGTALILGVRGVVRRIRASSTGPGEVSAPPAAVASSAAPAQDARPAAADTAPPASEPTPVPDSDMSTAPPADPSSGQ
ncbi:hypothetical protein JY651_24550 [Pyxidicoccus parkwayensis]|uniref:YtkA-like domain-containing protein n=1 Tax=Pyxidicoccus parkwayensis TaxID=2813578 RepID=A0ABX7PCS9_9BACT|nr:hypothetical protein JY651_24550 [Pyxidicoccus parkwaysis]